MHIDSDVEPPCHSVHSCLPGNFSSDKNLYFIKKFGGCSGDYKLLLYLQVTISTKIPSL